MHVPDAANVFFYDFPIRQDSRRWINKELVDADNLLTML